MKDNNSITIVLPIYNDALLLKSKLPLIRKKCKRIMKDNSCIEIIVVDNGSDDILKSKIDNSIRYIRLKEPNYGEAIKVGLNAASNKFAYVLDIDQFDLPFFEWSYANKNRYSIIFSSKRLDPSLNKQSVLRYFLSWGLNSLLQLLFALPASDTHGQKLINTYLCKSLLKSIKADRGQYDVELVVMGLANGYKMAQVPVPYDEIRRPRNSIIKKIIWNIIALIKLYIRIRPVTYKKTNLTTLPRSSIVRNK